MAVPLGVDLPWQQLAAQGNALAGLGGDPGAAMQQLGQSYNQSYQGALGLNAAMYNGLQTGYQNLRDDVGTRYQDIAAGYSTLYGDVLGRISGTNTTDLNDIQAQSRAQSGRATQDMVNRGLGNSTLQQSVQRGIEQDSARARTNSQERFAQLGANYASQIGQAGLQARQQGIGLGANLGQAQLGMTERVNVPYPDAGMYSNLAQMYGAQQEADSQRQQMQQSRSMGGGGGGGNYTVGPSAGFAPRPNSMFEGGYGGGAPQGGPMPSYYGGGYSPQPYQPNADLGFSGGNYEPDSYDSTVNEGWNQGSGEGNNPYYYASASEPPFYNYVGAGDGSSMGDGDYAYGEW